MPKLPTIKIRDLSEGVFQGLDEGLNVREYSHSVALSINLFFHKKMGRAVLRKGLTQLGSQIVASKSCLGLFQFNKSDGTKIPLAVFNDSGNTNSDVFKLTGSPLAWTKAKENLTASLKTRFLTFLDTVAVVNGTEKFTSTDCSNWISTGGNLDVGNMPSFDLIIEWKDRVYGVDNTDKNKLQYSSTPTAGAISFTSGNGSIEIEPEDGTGNITGLAKVPGYLLLFKERGLKRWDGNSTYPEDLITIGCPSQEAIVQTKQSVFYYNKRGVYETTGGFPRKISRRIQDIIDAIPSSYYSSVSGWGDGENIIFSIGDISLYGLTLTNCVVSYNIDSQIWSFHTFPKEFKKCYNYIDSNEDEFVIAGDDDGNVWKVFEGNDDNGTDISWLIQTQQQEFGSRGRIKEFSKFVVYSKDVRNGQMSAKINGQGDYKPFSTGISKDSQEMTFDLKGNYFDFRLQGRGQNVEIIGLEFPELSVCLNYTL